MTTCRQLCSPQKIPCLWPWSCFPQTCHWQSYQPGQTPQQTCTGIAVIAMTIFMFTRNSAFLISISKVFTHFLSGHTFLVTPREPLTPQRFHFSSKGKGVAADSPLHRCVLSLQVCPCPQHFSLKAVCCAGGHCHPWEMSLYQWKWCWCGCGGFNLFQEPEIPL